MKPNRAQIEAALSTYYGIELKMGEAALAERMAAALTAAAEVAYEDAAEAESEHQLDPERAPLTPHGMALVNATIEECAKVASTFLSDGEEVPYGICEKIAAAIRALEDKP